MQIIPVLPSARQKFPPYIAGYLEFFAYISEVLFIYSTDLGGTPNDVLRNPDWETPM